MTGDTDSRSPYTTVSPFHRSLEALGRPPSHIQYERDTVEIRGRRDGDGDVCDHLKAACTVLSWTFKKPSNQPDPKGRRPQSPDGSKSRLGSHTSTSRSEGRTTSNPPPQSTTILASTSQSPSSSPPSPTYSSSQSTALETSTETSQSSASETSAGASTTALTTSPGSNNGGASTSSTPASEGDPDPASTIVLTSTVVSSVNSYPQTLPPYMAHSSGLQSPSPSSFSNGPSESQRLSNSPRLSPGTIAGIALGALALLLCAALALFLLLRRRRRWGKRRSIESARRRLDPYSYDDDSSRPVSSVWTWFGSVSADPDFKPHRREPSPNSLDFKFAEKGAEAGHLGYGAYSPSPSPCPSPKLAETQPLAGDGSSPPVRHSLRRDEGLSHLNVPPSIGLEPSSSSELLALARTDYAVAAHRFYHQGDGGLERSNSRIQNTPLSDYTSKSAGSSSTKKRPPTSKLFQATNRVPDVVQDTDGHSTFLNPARSSVGCGRGWERSHRTRAMTHSTVWIQIAMSARASATGSAPRARTALVLVLVLARA